MTEIDTAEHVLLANDGLAMRDCERALGTLMSHHLDMGELFFQSVRSEAWGLEDGIVKEGTFSADRGVGVRAVSGEKTGFAYADEISTEAIGRAALAARSIARVGGAGAVKAFSRASPILRYVGVDPITTLSADEKVALLSEIDREARRIDPRVKEVTVRVAAVHETNLVVASDGTLAADSRPLVRMDVSVIVEQSGRRERASPAVADGARHVGSSSRNAVPRSRAKRCAGTRQSRSGGSAGRTDDRRARPRLARRVAARSGGPRTRRRLQP